MDTFPSTHILVKLAMGAAYGTAKSGTGIAAMAVMRPEAIMKSIIPVVMAGMWIFKRIYYNTHFISL